MFLLNLKKKIKNKLIIRTANILNIKKNNLYHNYKNNSGWFTFGDKNPDKKFYVIKRTPGTGMFSNVLFVLNHLKIAQNNNYIPFVDMFNFPSIYNESKKIYGTNNSWEYFFENFTNIDIDEIYQSKNVFITSNNFEKNFLKDLNTEEIKKDFRENIIVKKKYNKLVENFAEKHFKNKKILGVHFRGTSYKRSPGHPFPATKKQILKKIKEIQIKEKIDKIFLVTEEKNYKDFLLSKFGSKIIYLKSPYRSNINDAFKIYPRNIHRFKLGREAVIETLLLSKCDIFIYVTSNIASASIAWNLNSKQKKYKINNGINSNNIFLSQILWYIKKNIPSFLGGFRS